MAVWFADILGKSTMFMSESLHKKKTHICKHSFEDALFVPGSMSTDLHDDNLKLQIPLYWAFLKDTKSWFEHNHEENEPSSWTDGSIKPRAAWHRGDSSSLHLLSSIPAAGEYWTPAALTWATSYLFEQKKPVTAYGREENKRHEMGISQRAMEGVAASQPTGESKNLLRCSSAGFMKSCVTEGVSWGMG